MPATQHGKRSHKEKEKAPALYAFYPGVPTEEETRQEVAQGKGKGSRTNAATAPAEGSPGVDGLVPSVANMPKREDANAPRRR